MSNDICWGRKRNGRDSEGSEVGLGSLDEIISSCGNSVDDLGTFGDDEAACIIAEYECQYQ